MSEGFGKDFKRFFLRGLAAVLPTLLTIMIIVYVFMFVQRHIGAHMNHAVQWLVAQYRQLVFLGEFSWKISEEERKAVERYWAVYRLGWIGFLLAISAVYVFGRFVASYLGRGAWRLVERGILSLPLVKRIYPYVKQVTDFLFSEQKLAFSRVVAVEYPRRGCWSLGLVTSPGMRTLQESMRRNLLTVFIPSSPTPVTGYTIVVGRDEVIDLPLTIDQAIRFIVSGGVIMPPGESLSEAEIERARQGSLPPASRTNQETSE